MWQESREERVDSMPGRFGRLLLIGGFVAGCMIASWSFAPGRICGAEKTPGVSAEAAPTPPAAGNDEKATPARISIEEYVLPSSLGEVKVASVSSTATGYALTAVKGDETYLLLYEAGQPRPFRIAKFAPEKR